MIITPLTDIAPFLKNGGNITYCKYNPPKFRTFGFRNSVFNKGAKRENLKNAGFRSK